MSYRTQLGRELAAQFNLPEEASVPEPQHLPSPFNSNHWRLVARTLFVSLTLCNCGKLHPIPNPHLLLHYTSRINPSKHHYIRYPRPRNGTHNFVIPFHLPQEIRYLHATCEVCHLCYNNSFAGEHQLILNLFPNEPTHRVGPRQDAPLTNRAVQAAALIDAI